MGFHVSQVTEVFRWNLAGSIGLFIVFRNKFNHRASRCIIKFTFHKAEKKKILQLSENWVILQKPSRHNKYRSHWSPKSLFITFSDIVNIHWNAVTYISLLPRAVHSINVVGFRGGQAGWFPLAPNWGVGEGEQSPHFPNSRYLYLAFELRKAKTWIAQLGVFFKGFFFFTVSVASTQHYYIVTVLLLALSFRLSVMRRHF